MSTLPSTHLNAAKIHLQETSNGLFLDCQVLSTAHLTTFIQRLEQRIRMYGQTLLPGLSIHCQPTDTGIALHTDGVHSQELKRRGKWFLAHLFPTFQFEQLTRSAPVSIPALPSPALPCPEKLKKIFSGRSLHCMAMSTLPSTRVKPSQFIIPRFMPCSPPFPSTLDGPIKISFKDLYVDNFIKLDLTGLMNHEHIEIFKHRLSEMVYHNLPLLQNVEINIYRSEYSDHVNIEVVNDDDVPHIANNMVSFLSMAFPGFQFQIEPF